MQNEKLRKTDDSATNPASDTDKAILKIYSFTFGIGIVGIFVAVLLFLVKPELTKQTLALTAMLSAAYSTRYLLPTVNSINKWWKLLIGINWAIVVVGGIIGFKYDYNYFVDNFLIGAIGLLIVVIGIAFTASSAEKNPLNKTQKVVAILSIVLSASAAVYSLINPIFGKDFHPGFLSETGLTWLVFVAVLISIFDMLKEFKTYRDNQKNKIKLMLFFSIIAAVYAMLTFDGWQ
ncbi:hypothetical protein OH460_08335 [Vibrio sp. Makdt]|uniref:hypothetical protein n=1 Tax=Vibrio sp. Makdt TaxID=2998828 RepID=UPI0022CDB090|nr:hypothetical protein [Vibrio sp. Makdt]MDA0152307.1 hypothetical protein [Vibrio sp. Makdt]